MKIKSQNEQPVSKSLDPPSKELAKKNTEEVQSYLSSFDKLAKIGEKQSLELDKNKLSIIKSKEKPKEFADLAKEIKKLENKIITLSDNILYIEKQKNDKNQKEISELIANLKKQIDQIKDKIESNIEILNKKNDLKKNVEEIEKIRNQDIIKSSNDENGGSFNVFNKKNYQKKFQALNKETNELGTIGKIRRFFRFNFLKIFLEDYFKINWEVHFAAEHMSQDSLAGGSTDAAIDRTLAYLNKYQKNHNQDHIIDSLTYAKQIEKKHQKTPFEKTLLYLKILDSDANKVKNDVKNLKVGESLAIPSNSSDHAMLLHISCIGENKEGLKTYRVVQHNEGDGIQYHYTRLNGEGRIQYQTALVIDNVSEENICGQNSQFFEDLFNNLNGSTEKLYLEILPQLKGAIKPSKDPRHWSFVQLGGSCSCRCLLSFIRSQMSEKEFQGFEDQTKIEILYKSYQQIKSGWGHTYTQKIVTLEAVLSLESSLKKRNIRLPDELQEMKNQLKKTIKKDEEYHLNGIHLDIAFDKNGEISSKKVSDNLNIALTILQKGKFTSDTMQQACLFMKAALNCKKPTIGEIADLSVISNNFCKIKFPKKRTREQTYVITAFATILKEKIDSYSYTEKEALGLQLNEIFKKFHTEFNIMNVSSHISNSDFDPLLNKAQKSLYQSQKIQISNDMKKFLSFMRK